MSMATNNHKTKRRFKGNNYKDFERLLVWLLVVALCLIIYKVMIKETVNDSNSIYISNIPYFAPSPPRKIDELIKKPPLFKAKELIIKNRFLNDADNNRIELVGVRDYGRCESTGHKWKGICPYCMYNCMHTIKINGKLQTRKYSHLEILIIQNRKVINKIMNIGSKSIVETKNLF